MSQDVGKLRCQIAQGPLYTKNEMIIHVLNFKMIFPVQLLFDETFKFQLITFVKIFCSSLIIDINIILCTFLNTNNNMNGTLIDVCTLNKQFK
jgi:hypothetical protein